MNPRLEITLLMLCAFAQILACVTAMRRNHTGYTVLFLAASLLSLILVALKLS